MHHFSLSTKTIFTPMIWRVDGTKHPGPRRDWHSWLHFTLQVKNANRDVPFRVWQGERYVQIGRWRIAEIDDNHMSIASGLTSDIYRGDGTVHPGPRWDFTAWEREHQQSADCFEKKDVGK